jgi:endonuclease/exonuclease/phosphatase family metal-dependent hydrolase
MRIATWNMHHCMESVEARMQAWDYLRDELGADLALVQEAVPPPSLASAYRPIDEDNWRLNWGSAVVALRPDVVLRPRPRVPLALWGTVDLTGDELPDSHPGACAVADVCDADGQLRFTAISLYGQWERVAPCEWIYSCARVHRILSDMTGVLCYAYSTPVILAGDFNLTTQVAFDGQTQADTDGAVAAFARIRAWGLTECVALTRDSRPRLEGCECAEGDACSHVQTFRYQKRPDARPTQLDYVFVSESLVPAVRECRVADEVAAWALSDHCPIVLDIE